MRWSRNGDAELEAVRDAEVQADIRAGSVQSDYPPEIELGVGALLPGKGKSARFMSGSALGILIPKEGDIRAQVKRRTERQADAGRSAIRQMSTAPRSVDGCIHFGRQRDLETGPRKAERDGQTSASTPIASADCRAAGRQRHERLEGDRAVRACETVDKA